LKRGHQSWPDLTAKGEHAGGGGGQAWILEWLKIGSEEERVLNDYI